VVFVTFGASASAVGRFLLHNRSLAGTTGWSVDCSVWPASGGLAKQDLDPGGAADRRAAGGGALTVRLNPGLLGRAAWARQLVSVSLIFLAGPFLTRWLNRDAHFRNLGGQPGYERLS